MMLIKRALVWCVDGPGSRQGIGAVGICFMLMMLPVLLDVAATDLLHFAKTSQTHLVLKNLTLACWGMAAVFMTTVFVFNLFRLVQELRGLSMWIWARMLATLRRRAARKK